MQSEWEKDDARAYGLDLTEDHGLRPITLIGSRPGMRRFDGHRLAAQIKTMLAEFKQGTTPRPWAQATTVPQPACARLLVSPTDRGACLPQAGVSPAQEGGQHDQHRLEAIGLLVSGRLSPPNRHQTMDSRHDLNMITFQGGWMTKRPHRRCRAEVRRRFHLDRWNTVDHWFRIQAATQTPGQRIEHHQLGSG